MMQFSAFTLYIYYYIHIYIYIYIYIYLFLGNIDKMQGSHLKFNAPSEI